MRVMPVFLLLILASCGPAPAPEEATAGNQTLVDETYSIPSNQKAGMPNAPILGACGGEHACELSEREMIGKDWPRAWRGDYQGQRNVAFCLSDGCNRAVRVDPVAGCAWRIVIMQSGHDQADKTDPLNLKADCSRLTADEQAAAKIKARAIAVRINSVR